MKKMIVLMIFVFCLISMVFAGGIVTNTNQSAAFMRTLNRNASTDVDAAYFNPAGLTKLSDGLHFDISNQSIWQMKTIDNSTTTLHKSEFVGKVQALMFPTAYAVYKKNRIAVALGVNPIGGGGSADYDKGLPSFEAPVSGLKTSLAQIGVTDYDLDVSFSGSSIYLGFQGGVAFKLNDIVSIFGGARLVTASNGYEGYLKNIQVNRAGTWESPWTFFETQATATAGAASSLQPLIDGGASALTLAQAQGAGYLSADQVAQLEGGLVAAGVDPTGYNIAQVQGAYSVVSATMTATGNAVKAQTSDKEVDAAQKGSGIAAIIGLNLTPMEGLNIGIRYESKAKMELENETEKDDTGLFPDGAKTGADMPSQFALGVSYCLTPKLKLMSDFNFFNNANVDWDSAEVNFDNTLEFGLAAEYKLTEKLLVSAGYLKSTSGAKSVGQSDMDYNLDSWTLGAGLRYSVTPSIAVNIGALNTFYTEAKKTTGTIIEKYNQTTFGFAFGLQASL
ncbi:MAG: hypothetical protein PHW79_06420 [Candidatus Marinimicrobia bacterium]|nr:hypothetical protein [Candidatus Neomarinimicrobiota bacterium]